MLVLDCDPELSRQNGGPGGRHHIHSLNHCCHCCRSTWYAYLHSFTPLQSYRSVCPPTATKSRASKPTMAHMQLMQQLPTSSPRQQWCFCSNGAFAAMMLFAKTVMMLLIVLLVVFPLQCLTDHLLHFYRVSFFDEGFNAFLECFATGGTAVSCLLTTVELRAVQLLINRSS
jgi:hypothetical protein